MSPLPANSHSSFQISATCYGIQAKETYGSGVVNYGTLAADVPNMEALGNLACDEAEGCYNQVRAAIQVKQMMIRVPTVTCMLSFGSLQMLRILYLHLNFTNILATNLSTYKVIHNLDGRIFCIITFQTNFIIEKGIFRDGSQIFQIT